MPGIPLSSQAVDWPPTHSLSPEGLPLFLLLQKIEWPQGVPRGEHFLLLLRTLPAPCFQGLRGGPCGHLGTPHAASASVRESGHSCQVRVHSSTLSTSTSRGSPKFKRVGLLTSKSGVASLKMHGRLPQGRGAGRDPGESPGQL